MNTQALANTEKLSITHLKILMDCHGSCISNAKYCTKPSGSRTQMNILSDIVQAVFSMCFKRVVLQKNEGPNNGRQLFIVSRAN
jgi:hypothetical protein